MPVEGLLQLLRDAANDANSTAKLKSGSTLGDFSWEATETEDFSWESPESESSPSTDFWTIIGYGTSDSSTDHGNDDCADCSTDVGTNMGTDIDIDGGQRRGQQSAMNPDS